MCGAGVSILTGYVARSRGFGRGQGVWAAWWLGASSIPLNLVETATGLRPAIPLSPLAIPPGVSTLVNVADPNTAGILLGTSLAVVLMVGIAGLIVVTPFALLGYWAYGDNKERPTHVHPRYRLSSVARPAARALLDKRQLMQPVREIACSRDFPVIDYS
jgi:hypothetical protein